MQKDSENRPASKLGNVNLPKFALIRQLWAVSAVAAWPEGEKASRGHKPRLAGSIGQLQE